MNKLIIPTGYMGSGSSAITDLISEFEGFTAEHGSYEYVFMHCPNGIFDLEDKLLHGNNAVRSDEALHSFMKTMRQLYDKKYWWVGHYQTIVGPEFWQYTLDYVEELVQFKPNYYWYYQENADFKMIVKLVARRILRTITLGRYEMAKPLVYSPMLVSFVDNDEFHEITRNYLDKIWKLLGLEEKNIILDQLLLPFNLHRAENYFGENAHVFVVERDPRDVFISNKYIWSKQNETVPYPIDINEFCNFYKKLRNKEIVIQNENVHRVKFEDLIYKYDNTVKEILENLGLNEAHHVLKREKFNPDRSINNTQLFLNMDYRDEMKVIEEELGEFLYEFPFERKSDTSKVF